MNKRYIESIKNSHKIKEKFSHVAVWATASERIWACRCQSPSRRPRSTAFRLAPPPSRRTSLVVEALRGLPSVPLRPRPRCRAAIPRLVAGWRPRPGSPVAWTAPGAPAQAPTGPLAPHAAAAVIFSLEVAPCVCNNKNQVCVVSLNFVNTYSDSNSDFTLIIYII